MRIEKEMLDLIIRTAREDERIIAAYLEGSRSTRTLKRYFRDYDVEYIVRDTAPFIADKSWIDRFGERLFMQYPDDCPFEKSDTKTATAGSFGFRTATGSTSMSARRSTR